MFKSAVDQYAPPPPKASAKPSPQATRQSTIPSRGAAPPPPSRLSSTSTSYLVSANRKVPPAPAATTIPPPPPPRAALRPNANLNPLLNTASSFSENSGIGNGMNGGMGLGQQKSAMEEASIYFNEDDIESDICFSDDEPIGGNGGAGGNGGNGGNGADVVYPTLPEMKKEEQDRGFHSQDLPRASQSQTLQPQISQTSQTSRAQPAPAPSAFQHLEGPYPKPDIPMSSPAVEIPWSSSPVRPPPEEPPKKKSKRTLPQGWDTEPKTLAEKRGKPADDLGFTLAAVKMDEVKATRERNAKRKEAIVVPTPADTALSAKSHTLRPARVFLSDEQKQVLHLVTHSKRSVFFTGAAGTGKSVLLREIIAQLKQKHRKEHDAVAVTASTGLAACNIGGVTLHSFAGIGLGKEPVPDLVRKIKINQKAKNRWLRTKILIIDEISMVDGDLFDKLENIARLIRNSGLPFGGIQLVITGDFFQLPPVPEGGKPATFAFDAKTWCTSINDTIGLTHVFRQRDNEFATMLNEMRKGHLSPSTIETFKKLNRPLHFNDGIMATELFSTRREVDLSNTNKLRQLSGMSMKFKADDTGTVRQKEQRDRLLQSCMAPVEIELKINAQVMLIKNLDDTLVNGSLGRVVGFMNEKTYDIYNENGDLQGAFDDNETELTKRQQNLRRLAHDSTPTSESGRRWPLVSFSLADGTSRQLLVQPEVWKVELPNGEVQAQRSQIPLILAWALSIHKAQGQTLERVRVDLGKAFEKGQAYVALSRATCKEGLQVLGFEARKVMAHERVREFYERLGDAGEIAARIRREEQEERKRKFGKKMGGGKRKKGEGEEEEDW